MLNLAAASCLYRELVIGENVAVKTKHATCCTIYNCFEHFYYFLYPDHNFKDVILFVLLHMDTFALSIWTQLSLFCFLFLPVIISLYVT